MSSLLFFCPCCGDSLRFSSVPELRSHLVGRHSYKALLLLSQAQLQSPRPGALLPLPGPPRVQPSCLDLEPRDAPALLDCLDLASPLVQLLRNVRRTQDLAWPFLGCLALPDSQDSVPRGAILVHVDLSLEERLGLGLDRQITWTSAEVKERVSWRVGYLGLELQRKEAELQRERQVSEQLRDQKQEVEQRAEFLSRQVAEATKMMGLMKNQLSDREEELRQREQEMADLDRFLRATAEKESEAKFKLQVFIETLLERAERAERLLRGGRSLDHYFIAHKLEGTSRNRRSCSVSGNYWPEEELHSDPIGWTSTSVELKENRGWGRTWNRKNLRHHSMEEEQEEEEEEDHLWSSAEIRSLIFAKTHTSESGTSSSVWSCCRHSNLGVETLRLRAGLFCVFPYLDVHSLLLAAEVCSDWRIVARHPAVWTRLRLENSQVSTVFLTTLSQWCTQTELIVLNNLKPRSRRAIETQDDYLRNIRGSVEAGLELILRSAGGSLLSFSVSGCSHIVTDRLLWLTSCYSRNLQSLRYQSSTDPPGPEVLWALGAGCRSLTSLQVAPALPSRQLTRFGNRCLQTIGRCWPRLHTLSVGGAGCGTQGLVSVIRSCTDLQVLELVCISDLSLKVATELCSAGLKKLHTLILTHTAVNGQALLHFQNLVQDLHTLVVRVSAEDYFEDPGSEEAEQSFREILDTLKVLQTCPGLCDILQVQT